MTEQDVSFLHALDDSSREVRRLVAENRRLKTEIAVLRDRNDALRGGDQTDPCRVDQQEIAQRE